MSLSYLVAQLGARMHYGIPRLLHKAGMLECLHTDLYAGSAFRKLLGAFPRSGGLARMKSRHASGLPDHSVVTFPMFGAHYAVRLRLARSEADRGAAFLWAGSKFGKLVCSRGFGKATAVYTYNDAALEILRYARMRGLFTVLEQTIAPLAAESELLDVERSKFPGWEVTDSGVSLLRERCCRQQAEWEAADLIVCGSDFVMDGIRQAGGPADRCRVVPYGFDGGSRPCPTRSVHQSTRALPGGARKPLRVLTVGAVGLRKGTPYVWQAARQMGRAAEFRMVGPIQLADQARRDIGRDVQLLGPVPRNSVHEHYGWADVFLLPSICEGSATVTYEALAAGLPVICTPNTGSVVTHGIDGFIVPPGDHHSIVKALESLLLPAKLQTMSGAAVEKASEFTLEAYGRRALAALATEGALV